MGQFDVDESSVFTSYVVKDFGYYKRHIVMKNPIRKKGYEAVDDIENGRFDDLIIDEEIYSNIPKEKDIIVKTELSEIQRLSRLRAKNRVHAMAMLNNWDYMITLTFDPKKFDMSNLNDLKKKTLNWFKKQYVKYGIKYLILPEFQKNGNLHWHGFISDPNGSMKLSLANCKSNKNHDIYNIDSWTSNKGFNTCAKLGKTYEDRAKVASYVMKYITKDMERIFDKYYYCSNGLLNEPKTEYFEVIPRHDDWYENDYCFIYDEIVGE